MSAKRPPSGTRPLFDRKRIDGIRRRLDDADNALLDEWAAGRIDRRTFLRQASVLGILPLMGGVAVGSAAGNGASKPLRVGVAMPHGAIDPLLINDSASYQLIFQVAEFLCITEPDLTLRPVLAESW